MEQTTELTPTSLFIKMATHVFNWAFERVEAEAQRLQIPPDQVNALVADLIVRRIETTEGKPQ